MTKAHLLIRLLMEMPIPYVIVAKLFNIKLLLNCHSQLDPSFYYPVNDDCVFIVTVMTGNSMLVGISTDFVNGIPVMLLFGFSVCYR